MEQFLAEIRMFSYNTVPKGWALCNGQTLPIKQNAALYSLIGVTFGGDGTTNFMLPDLRGKLPIHVGTSTDGNTVTWGQKLGTATNTMTLAQLGPHTHQLNASNLAGNTGTPTGNIFGNTGTGDNDFSTYAQNPPPALTAMSPLVIAMSGSAAPINNMMPFLGINYMIAILGVYPPRP